jgi:hypothetical protein
MNKPTKTKAFLLLFLLVFTLNAHAQVIDDTKADNNVVNNGQNDNNADANDDMGKNRDNNQTRVNILSIGLAIVVGSFTAMVVVNSLNPKKKKRLRL